VQPGASGETEERGITEAESGKRLLQLVSGTLAANPMCTRMIPQRGRGGGADPAALFDLNREPELQRPGPPVGPGYCRGSCYASGRLPTNKQWDRL